MEPQRDLDTQNKRCDISILVSLYRVGLALGSSSESPHQDKSKNKTHQGSYQKPAIFAVVKKKNANQANYCKHCSQSTDTQFSVASPFCPLFSFLEREKGKPY
jgi:hypothetical protein